MKRTAVALVLAVVAGAVPVLAPPASAQATCTVYDAVTDAELTSFPVTSTAIAVECDSAADLSLTWTLDGTSYPQLRANVFEPIARPHDPWVTIFPGTDHSGVQWTVDSDSTECFLGTFGPALGTICAFPVTGTPQPSATAHVDGAFAVVIYAADLASGFQLDSVTAAPHSDPSTTTTTTTTTSTTTTTTAPAGPTSTYAPEPVSAREDASEEWIGWVLAAGLFLGGVVTLIRFLLGLVRAG